MAILTIHQTVATFHSDRKLANYLTKIAYTLHSVAQYCWQSVVYVWLKIVFTITKNRIVSIMSRVAEPELQEAASF
jgi:hypothetical protein